MPYRRFSSRETNQHIERYRISGLTCADCAARIERTAAGLPGVRGASLNLATGALSLQVEKDPPTDSPDSPDSPGTPAAPHGSTANRADALARLVHEIEPSASLHRNEIASTPDRATRRRILRVVIALGLFVLAATLRWATPEREFVREITIVLYGLSYALAGYQVIWNAVLRAVRGRPMDEYFLMTIATAGAWLLGESGEAAAVMVFYQIGDTLQAAAVNRSRNAVAALLDLRPRTVRRLRRADDGGVAAETATEEAGEDGAREELIGGAPMREELVEPSWIAPGDLVVCLPGERIAVDGIVHQGAGALDASAVTGESVPRAVEPGMELHAGTVSLDARLVIRAVAPEAESTVARMLALVEDAAGRKAPTEQMMTRLARFYTPVVVAVAGALALVPPALGLGTFETWVYRALVFLVVSCPCALVVSIPLGYFAGIGAASRRGILVKGGQFLDALARVKTVVFDKTGTITTGKFAVSRVISWHGPGESAFHDAISDAEIRFREALLATGYRAALRSNHPASLALRAEGRAVLPAEVVALIEEETANDETREFAGRGVVVTNGEERICAGSASHLEAQGIAVPTLPDDTHGTPVHVARGTRYLGCILVADRIRPSSVAAVSALRRRGIDRVVLLSGDRRAAAAEVGRMIGADTILGELLPEGKVRELEALVEESRISGRGGVAFAGDGINDAAVIARADVGIAMGGIGSDAAVEAADVVLMGDDPGLVPTAIDGAVRTQKIVMQNVVFALSTKAVFLAAAASGAATMWMAVFADVGVTVVTVLNTLRILGGSRSPRSPGGSGRSGGSGHPS